MVFAIIGMSLTFTQKPSYLNVGLVYYKSKPTGKK